MAGLLDRLRASPALPWLAVALFALLAVDLVRSLPGTRQVTLLDFPAYRSAGRHVLEGEPERLYRTDKYFTNLPVVALALTPLAKLRYPAAWRLFWWLQLASWLATGTLLLWGVYRFFPPLDPTRAALAAAIFLAFAPVLRRCLVLGQTTPMVVLGFAGFALLLRAGRPRLAGGLLGLVCLVKLPPLLLLPALWLRRRREAAGAALAVLALGVGVSWAVFGGDVMAQYADTVIGENLGRTVAAFNNRSLEGTYARLLGAGSLVDWRPTPRPRAVTLAVAATLLALLAPVVLRGRGLWLPRTAPRDGDPRHGSFELELALASALMLLALPIAWIHYYLFLAVPLTLLPFWWQSRGLPLHAGWAALFVLVLWLVAGGDVAGNEFYAAHAADPLVRARLEAQPLGAALLLACCAHPLGILARRRKEAGAPSASDDRA